MTQDDMLTVVILLLHVVHPVSHVHALQFVEVPEKKKKKKKKKRVTMLIVFSTEVSTYTNNISVKKKRKKKYHVQFLLQDHDQSHPITHHNQ